MEHWLISFKCHNYEAAAMWEALRAEVLKPDVCLTSVFAVDQQFKAGSLDSLVALADDLSKLDHQVEGTLRKIERQYADLENNPALQIAVNNRGAVDYQTPASYLADFKWDISKFPPSKPLPELMTTIDEQVKTLDDGVKSQVSKFVEMRNQLSQATKKESGGLMNRDLNDVLTPEVCNSEDFINTEYIKTLLVVVPKKEAQQWINTYEFLSPKVVPQSTKQFSVDETDGNTLWRVVILKVGQDEFLANAKKNRWAVREFEFNPGQNEVDKKQREVLREEFGKRQSQLVNQCKSVFSEVYIAMVHLKAIRIYIESILRYSLPPQFFAISVTPKDGKEKKILDGLIKKCLKPGEKANLYCSREESEDGEDFFPFVFLRMPKY
jgi:V-type H+-transporting ATPase subunit C